MLAESVLPLLWVWSALLLNTMSFGYNQGLTPLPAAMHTSSCVLPPSGPLTLQLAPVCLAPPPLECAACLMLCAVEAVVRIPGGLQAAG